MSTVRDNSSQSTSPRKIYIPIRIKITLPYVILSLILAISAGYLVSQLVIENIEERFDKQLFEAGKISSELIVNYESELLRVQRLIANTEGVSVAIQAKDANALKSLSFGVIVNEQQEAVEIFDLQGTHLISFHHRSGGNPEDYDISTGGQTSFSNLEIVQNVLAKKNDSKGDKFADLIQTDRGYFLYISGPVYDADGNLTGVVLVGESLPSLAIDMRDKTFAQITFYNEVGQVLYSTLPFPQDLTIEIASQTTLLKDVSSTKRDIQSQRDFTTSNILFSEILGAWEVRGNHELGVLGIALSQNAILQASVTSRWQIFFLVTSTFFLVIIIGIQLANTITRPITQLVNASMQVSEGNLNVEVETYTNDEISILTESFNTMVTSLHQSQHELLKAYDDTLEGWAKALELHDKETEGHSQRVIQLVNLLASEMGLEGEALVNIRRGALLHDIGKMGISDKILHKKEALTKEEMKVIRTHPKLAYDMLKKIDYLHDALEIPYSHHEKWDGTGYPQGLKGEEIPISARIFAVVDVWDAMIYDRSYRKAIPQEEVISYLKDQSGKHFDPKVVKTFFYIMNFRNNK